MRTTPMRILALAAALGVALVFVVGSTESSAADGGGQDYTAYNIWYEQPVKIWSTNYQKGHLLPAGTAIKNVRPSRKSLRFTAVETNITYTIFFVPNHHPGLAGGQVYDRLLTDKNFGQLTEGFSESEIEAIEIGKVVNGMSKAAVIVCYGYPPESGTPTMKAKTWKYWQSRFSDFEVEFDEDGKVIFTGS